MGQGSVVSSPPAENENDSSKMDNKSRSVTSLVVDLTRFQSDENTEPEVELKKYRLKSRGTARAPVINSWRRQDVHYDISLN